MRSSSHLEGVALMLYLDGILRVHRRQRRRRTIKSSQPIGAQIALGAVHGPWSDVRHSFSRVRNITALRFLGGRGV